MSLLNSIIKLYNTINFYEIKENLKTYEKDLCLLNIFIYEIIIKLIYEI